jgi:tetratricopeptide (TPR) repeat protein
LKIEQSRKKQDDANLMIQARQFFDQAEKLFRDAQADLRSRLEPINNRRYTPAEREEEERRDQLRRDYLQAQLLAAQVLEERAETFPPGSPERQQALDQAFKAYEEIEKKYRTLAAGLYARLAMGRCRQKQERFKEALGFFTDLLSDVNTPELRGIKTETLLAAMDCWLHPSQNLYLEAINQATKWQQELRPHEMRDPQVLQVRYKLALGHKLYADYLKQQDPKNRQSADHLRTARNLAVEVSRFPSPVQEAARQLVADIRGVALEETQQVNVKTFDEALRAAKDAYDQMQTAEFLVKTLPERLAQETDPQLKAEVQQQLETARQDAQKKREQAIDLYRRALTLANAETPVESLSMARVSLAHLLYLQGDYLEAAVLGEFLAVKFPAQSVAREAAAIALASLVQLYVTADVNDKPFAARRVQQLAERIIRQWPDQPVAADAWNALIPFVVQGGDFDKALQGIQSIPESLPQRGEVELRLGRALWAAYKQGMAQLRQAEGQGSAGPGSGAPKPEQLQAWKQQAEQILLAGVTRVRSGGRRDESLLLAALALSQLYIDTQQADRAVALLEDQDIGPLALLRAKDSLTDKPEIAEEIYRTALRAYLGSLISGQATNALEKAQSLMQEFKAALAAHPQGNQRLIANYLGLAREVKSQMELASFEEKKALLAGFELFLKQVVADSREFQVLYWAAETFYSLAESFDDPASAIAPQTANQLYRQAVDLFKKLLSEAEKDSNFLPDTRLKTSLEMRLALAQRRIGDFEGAVKTLLSILTKNNMALPVQVEAARTYQQWAQLPGRSEMYLKAMVGDYPDPQAKTPTNIIWGWGKIGKLTAGRKEFEDIFFESRLALAECRYRYALALAASNKQNSDRYLEMAKQDIWFTFRLYPELGGQKWLPKYDSLLKDIQKSLGQKVEGLAEFRRRLAESKPAG